MLPDSMVAVEDDLASLTDAALYRYTVGGFEVQGLNHEVSEVE